MVYPSRNVKVYPGGQFDTRIFLRLFLKAVDRKLLQIRDLLVVCAEGASGGHACTAQVAPTLRPVAVDHQR